MRCTFLKGAVAALALAAFHVAPAHAALVANGDFETGDLSGWTPFGDQEVVGVDDASNHGGTFGAYSGSLTLAGFSQSIATVAGQSYTLTFWLQAEDSGYIRNRPNSFSVSFGGVELDSMVDVAPFDYTGFSYDVVATGTSSSLVFTFLNAFSYFDLDDVSVVASAPPPAVPEPATWAMLLAGFALIGGSARYRRNRTATRFA